MRGNDELLIKDFGGGGKARARETRLLEVVSQESLS